MSNKDRIRLAEAMGWVRADPDFGRDTWQKGHVMAYAPGTQRDPRDEIPDPFTYANDDYAVLEWMHTQKFWTNDRLTYYMTQPVGDYRIGDYARAALKVIDNE